MSKITSNERKQERLSIRIEGMHCASCVSTIKSSLMKQEEVIDVSLNLLDEKAIVDYDSNRVDRSILEKVVESAHCKIAFDKDSKSFIVSEQQDNEMEMMMHHLIHSGGG